MAHKQVRPLMTSLSFSNRIKLYLAKANFTRSVGLYRFDGPNENCIISFRSTQFAVIEKITRSSNQIHIGHFSVNEPYRSRCIGETCLRKFAARIRALDRSVQSLEFNLYRAPTNSEHKKIGNARAKLLKRIGATNVSTATVGPVGNERIEVKGLWHRDTW